MPIGSHAIRLKRRPCDHDRAIRGYKERHSIGRAVSLVDIEQRIGLRTRASNSRRGMTARTAVGIKPRPEAERRRHGIDLAKNSLKSGEVRCLASGHARERTACP